MAEQLLSSPPPQSLSTSAARHLATTTKSIPQTVGVTPRWFLQLLPWVQVESGTYRVNRRKLILPAEQRIRVDFQGEQPRLEPHQLRSVPLLRSVSDSLLESLAGSLASERHSAGDTVLRENDPGDKFYIIAHGKVEVSTTGSYGQNVRLAVLGEGQHFGEIALLEGGTRTATVRALTPCVFLTLDRAAFDELMNGDSGLRDNLLREIREHHEVRASRVNEHGEGLLSLLSGHEGEPDLPQTFVDYMDDPREYTLSAVQSILRVHTRVSDLYNRPHDQLLEQLRLTIEEVKEKQEWEMINNREFGLLNSVAPSMCVQTRSGPPTPDDMDELLSRVWKKPAFFLAHPKAIAAFGRECTRRGVPPPTVEIFGSPFVTWRGVPLIPSNKIPVDGRSGSSTSILLLRVGEQDQGVIGLHQTGIPGEQIPGLSVRAMGIDSKAIASYLVTLYFSLAVLVEDAVGMLENVEVSNYYDYA